MFYAFAVCIVVLYRYKGKEDKYCSEVRYAWGQILENSWSKVCEIWRYILDNLWPKVR